MNLEPCKCREETPDLTPVGRGAGGHGAVEEEGCPRGSWERKLLPQALVGG